MDNTRFEKPCKSLKAGKDGRFNYYLMRFNDGNGPYEMKVYCPKRIINVIKPDTEYTVIGDITVDKDDVNKRAVNIGCLVGPAPKKD